MKTTRTTSLSILLGLAASCIAANAATVSYSFSELAANGSNVAADGAVHTSVAYGGGAPGTDPRIINGVDWNVGTPGRHDNPAFSFIDGRNIVSTFYDAGAIKATTDDIIFSATMILGINELMIGQQYRIQLISFDAEIENEGTPKQLRLQTLSSLGNTGSLDFQQFQNGDGSSQQHFSGALVTGVWTADATEIDFTIAARDGNDNSILNAFLVQAIPEPSSGLLAALGGLMLLRRRRS